MKPEIEELIARLEKATGPDRELDAEIASAVGWCPRDGYTRQSDNSWRSPSGDISGVTWAPQYTASIDAARTLVPENFSFELTQSAVEPPAMARARLWDWRRGPLAVDPGNEWKSEGNRPLAIALCIAALKARAGE